MDTLRTFDAEVEVAGWDEAFLAVTTDDPEGFAKRIQERVLQRTRLWCTIGIGDNRLQAKLASGFGKPRGVFVLTSDRWDESMHGLATTELWGIGSKTAAKLAELGVRTVGQLADADETALADRFGPSTGPWLASLGRGEGSAGVHPEGWIAKGRSREHTFQRDLPDPEEVGAEVARTAREVAGDLRRDERLAARVVVKVRFAPFFTSTHGVTLAEPTADPDLVAEAAARALERFDLDRPVRLVGVRAEMTPPVVQDGA
jgi:DNA polymerase-4